MLDLVLKLVLLIVGEGELALGALEINLEILDLFFEVFRLFSSVFELKFDLVELIFEILFFFDARFVRCVVGRVIARAVFFKLSDLVFEFCDLLLKTLVFLLKFFHLVHACFKSFFVKVFVFLVLFLSFLKFGFEGFDLRAVNFACRCARLGFLLRGPESIHTTDVSGVVWAFLSSLTARGRPEYHISVTLVSLVIVS